MMASFDSEDRDVSKVSLHKDWNLQMEQDEVEPTKSREKESRICEIKHKNCIKSSSTTVRSRLEYIVTPNLTSSRSLFEHSFTSFQSAAF